MKRKILLWLPAVVFLSLFFFYPLMRILGMSVDMAVFSPENLRLALDAFIFSLIQAGLSTLLTLLLGLPTAYLFTRYDFFGKPLIRALTAVPFLLPTVVVAAGFNALLGENGWLNSSLMHIFNLSEAPIQILGSLGAILLAHIFYNTTIVIRLVSNALSHLDSRIADAAHTLGADSRQVFSHVTLPLLQPSLLAASVLVFLFNFTSFGVILLLGGKGMATMEVEIYIQALQRINLPLSAFLSIIQLVCTLIFSIIYSRMVSRSTSVTIPRPGISNIKRVKSRLERVFIFGMIILLLSFFVAPLFALPLRAVTRLEPARGERGEIQYGLTMDYFDELFINRRNSLFYVPPIRAISVSLVNAMITMLFSLLLAFPVASALRQPGPLERLLDPFLMLPLGASAVTLGLGFIVSFNKPPVLLISSPLLVPLAHTIIALPFVIRTLQPALASIPTRLHQAAAALGAAPLRAWFAVDWAIVRRATLASAVFAFTISLGEFGATALISRPEYPTITMAVYRFLSQPGGLNYGQAMAMATILLILTLLGILFIERTRLPGAAEF